MTDNLLTPDQDKLDEAFEFISKFSSFIMGTVKENGQPHTSYAPYIHNDNHFYVFVSGLAEHSSTLKNGLASLFFIEDEDKAKTLFARTRLTIECQSTVIPRDSTHYEALLDQFQTRHGSTLKVLRSLPDFVLFQLSPLKANFVTGFGAAYDVSDAIADLSNNSKSSIIEPV